VYSDSSRDVPILTHTGFLPP